MNPSPGNIKDGLITDAIKSAGAAKKGGTSPVTAVLDYPEKVTAPGLNLLCTPGNDVESTTAEVASGATSLDVPVTTPGAYRAEVRMHPRHLTALLGYDRDTLVQKDMVWIYSNAIHVTP